MIFICAGCYLFIGQSSIPLYGTGIGLLIGVLIIVADAMLTTTSSVQVHVYNLFSYFLMSRALLCKFDLCS